MRVGDYRILYEIHDQVLLVIVVDMWGTGGKSTARQTDRRAAAAGARTDALSRQRSVPGSPRAGRERVRRSSRRRPAPAAVAYAPVSPGDRRPAVPLAAHHQVASAVPLPQAGRHDPHPSGRPGPGARAPGGLTDSGMTDIDPTSDIELHTADEHVIVRVRWPGR